MVSKVIDSSKTNTPKQPSETKHDIKTTATGQTLSKVEQSKTASSQQKPLTKVEPQLTTKNEQSKAYASPGTAKIMKAKHVEYWVQKRNLN